MRLARNVVGVLVAATWACTGCKAAGHLGQGAAAAAKTAVRVAAATAQVAQALSSNSEGSSTSDPLPAVVGRDPPSELASAYLGFADALGDASSMSDLAPFLASTARERLVGLSPGELRDELAATRRTMPQNITIEGEELHGARAMVKLEGARGQRSVRGELRLVREGEAWKVAALRWEP
jgi:hypothetical protein